MIIYVPKYKEFVIAVEVDGGGQMMTEMLVKDIPYTDVKRMVLDFVYPEHMHPKNEEDKLEILTIDKEYKYE